jgi:hypothetical protein
MTSETTVEPSEGKAASPQTALGWAQYLRERADDATAEGDTSVASHLEALALQMEKGSWDNYLAFERESHIAKIRDWEDQWKHSRAWQIENQRQVIGLGQSALRGLALINAGAVVALLAFLGNVWTKGVTIEPFLAAMWAFALGVGLAALASAFSYLTQLLYGSESEKTLSVAQGMHVTTLVVGLAALGVFCMGSYRTLDAFRHQDIRPPAAIAAAIDNGELERRNSPPPKRPPADPPKPVAPIEPSNPAKDPAKSGG